MNTQYAHTQIYILISVLLSGKDSDEHVANYSDRSAWLEYLPNRVKTALSFFGVIS